MFMLMRGFAHDLSLDEAMQAVDNDKFVQKFKTKLPEVDSLRLLEGTFEAVMLKVSMRFRPKMFDLTLK